MIKFINPDDKKKKIKDAVKLVKKHTHKVANNSIWGNWSTNSNQATWTVNNQQTTWTVNNQQTGIGGIFNPNTNGSITTNNVLVNNTNNNINNCITTTTTTTNPFTTTISSPAITTISNPNGTGGSIGGSIGNNNIAIGSSGIANGLSSTAIGTGTFVGYSSVVHSYKLLGKEVNLGFLPNAELVVSLINLLGADFWDEYKNTQNGLEIYYADAYAVIEEVLKPHRRDQKIDDIINGENK
jgi:hypothetical protein